MHLLRTVAKHQLGATVPGPDHASLVQGDDGMGRRPDHVCQLFIFLLSRPRFASGPGQADLDQQAREQAIEKHVNGPTRFWPLTCEVIMKEQTIDQCCAENSQPDEPSQAQNLCR